MKPPVLLRVYKDNKLVDVKQFQESQIVIGHNAEVQLDLDDSTVSALHAMLEEREDGFFISDLGSASGVFVGGEKVLDTRINPGDTFNIGPFKIEFFVGVPKPAAAPKAMPVEKQDVTVVASVPPAEPPRPPATEPKLPPVVVSDDSEELPTQQTEKVIDVTDEIPGAMTAVGVGAAPQIPIEIPADEASYTIEYTSEADYGSYAPESENKDLSEVIKPGVGTVVEVIVAWKERILSSHHFEKNGNYKIGSKLANDIVVPALGLGTSYNLLTIKSGAIIHVSNQMSGYILTGKTKRTLSEIRSTINAGASGIDVQLKQSELLCLQLDGGAIQIFVRYKQQTKKPIAAPIFDLTASEATSIALAFFVGVIFSLYMFVLAPVVDEEDLIEETLRKATVTFNAPKPLKRVKVADSSQMPSVKKKSNAKQTTKSSPGKAKALAPSKKVKVSKSKGIKTIRAGGSKKISKSKGSSVKSRRPDPTKQGMLGVLGAGGIMKSLDQAASGSGELTGLADSATGSSGFNEDRAGDGIGTKFKNTGSGKGASTVGIEGVGTKGSGTGISGFGSGGFGEKGKVNINLGGEEAFFEGSVDRDAVRRVIQKNKRAIKYCYTREKTSNSKVYGKVTLKWSVVDGGKVRGIKVSSNSTKSARLAKCVMNRIRGLKFPEPPPESTYVVEYPFLFSQ